MNKLILIAMLLFATGSFAQTAALSSASFSSVDNFTVIDNVNGTVTTIVICDSKIDQSGNLLAVSNCQLGPTATLDQLINVMNKLHKNDIAGLQQYYIQKQLEILRAWEKSNNQILLGLQYKSVKSKNKTE